MNRGGIRRGDGSSMVGGLGPLMPGGVIHTANTINTIQQLTAPARATGGGSKFELALALGAGILGLGAAAFLGWSLLRDT